MISLGMLTGPIHGILRQTNRSLQAITKPIREVADLRKNAGKYAQREMNRVKKEFGAIRKTMRPA